MKLLLTSGGSSRKPVFCLFSGNDENSDNDDDDNNDGVTPYRLTPKQNSLFSWITQTGLDVERRKKKFLTQVLRMECLRGLQREKLR